MIGFMFVWNASDRK